MKTKFLFFLFFLISMVACTTGSTEEENDMADKSAEVKYSTEVARTLSSFNDSIISVESGKVDFSKVQTRGLHNPQIAKTDILATVYCIKELCGFAGAVVMVSGASMTMPVFSATLGLSAIYGASASYSAYKHEKGGCKYATTMDDYYSTLKNDKDLSVLMDNFSSECIATYPEDKDSANIFSINTCEQVGELHNELLSLVEQKELQGVTRAISISQINSSEIKEAKSLKGAKANSYFVDAFSDDDIMSMKNKIIDDLPAYCEMSYTNVINQLKEEDVLTENSGDILSLFFCALYNSNWDEATLNAIVSKYENSVASSSELSISEKNILLMGFGMARHSCSYWYDKGY